MRNLEFWYIIFFIMFDEQCYFNVEEFVFWRLSFSLVLLVILWHCKFLFGVACLSWTLTLSCLSWTLTVSCQFWRTMSNFLTLKVSLWRSTLFYAPCEFWCGMSLSLTLYINYIYSNSVEVLYDLLIQLMLYFESKGIIVLCSFQCSNIFIFEYVNSWLWENISDREKICQIVGMLEFF